MNVIAAASISATQPSIFTRNKNMELPLPLKPTIPGKSPTGISPATPRVKMDSSKLQIPTLGFPNEMKTLNALFYVLSTDKVRKIRKKLDFYIGCSIN